MSTMAAMATTMKVDILALTFVFTPRETSTELVVLNPWLVESVSAAVCVWILTSAMCAVLVFVDHEWLDVSRKADEMSDAASTTLIMSPLWLGSLKPSV